MSNLTLIIGNKNYSSWSLRPWLYMNHVGIPFEERRIALYTDASHEKLAPYFSNYKVPALLDGDFIVWDSLAILEYLSEQYHDSNGWPRDARARALARSVSAEMHSSFVALRSELPMNCRKRFSNVKLSANAQNDVDRVTALWRKCRSEYGEGGDWLFGQFSIADAMYAPVVLRLAGYGIPLSGVEESYVQTTLKHPDLLEWIMDARHEKQVLAEYEKVV